MDLREGIFKEHMLMNDSIEPFTTGDYGSTTTHVLEHILVPVMSPSKGQDASISGTNQAAQQLETHKKTHVRSARLTCT